MRYRRRGGKDAEPQASPSPSTRRAAADAAAVSDSKARFEAYNRLQAAAAFGEKLPIPEIVAVGGQSDGKISLLEVLLGFRLNASEVEMGTRRPLVLQMVHDPTALDPRCLEEDSEEYGSPSACWCWPRRSLTSSSSAPSRTFGRSRPPSRPSLSS